MLVSKVLERDLTGLLRRALHALLGLNRQGRQLLLAARIDLSAKPQGIELLVNLIAPLVELGAEPVDGLPSGLEAGVFALKLRLRGDGVRARLLPNRIRELLGLSEQGDAQRF